jgi:saccharopine dehydrogenase-like NADP-dependent oxidoreductase
MERRLLLVGAGKIGAAVAHLLRTAPEFSVTLADRDEVALRRAAADSGAEVVVADIDDPGVLDRMARDADFVASAAPFQLTPAIARAARDAGAHYFDLTEDVASTRIVKALADGATAALVPQCGLAPGFVSIVAADLAATFDELRSVSMRVGALPQFPTNALQYNLTWSTDGLINEYCNPCEAIVAGERREVLPLEELEVFSLDGVTYEAFNTSGGLGTLCDTLLGRVETLDYKTIRYPGHRDIMKVLVSDLRLSHRRDLLKDVLEAAVPITYQDVVLVFVTVAGIRDGRLTQETFARKIYAAEVDGLLLSAIQLTTAAGLCTMMDLVREEKLPTVGFVRQEQCALGEFLRNRFGRLYLQGRAVAA